MREKGWKSPVSSKDPRGKPRGIFSTIPAPTALYAIACNLPPHRDSRYTPRSRSRCCVAPPCLRSNLFPRTLRPTAPSPPVNTRAITSSPSDDPRRTVSRHRLDQKVAWSRSNPISRKIISQRFSISMQASLIPHAQSRSKLRGIPIP